MSKHTIVFACLCLIATQIHAIEVIMPEEEQHSHIVLHDPDQDIYTLGKPKIIFDLSAGSDSLLDLKIRRSNLRMPDGSAFTAFAGHKDQNLVIIANGNVAHIDITGVSENGNSDNNDRDALVLFRRKDGSLISPPPANIAVFNTRFEQLDFNYTPLAVPDNTATLPVNILLDVSGSMSGFMDDVLAATRDFLTILPDFARCRVFAFNETLHELTYRITPVRCPAAVSSLNKVPTPSGGTNLLKALSRSFKKQYKPTPGLRPVTLVITDGIDTSQNSRTQTGIAEAFKVLNDAHLFVFRAGHYQPEQLEKIADLQIGTESDLKNELERFFHDLGLSLSGLQVLTIKGR